MKNLFLIFTCLASFILMGYKLTGKDFEQKILDDFSDLSKWRKTSESNADPLQSGFAYIDGDKVAKMHYTATNNKDCCFNWVKSNCRWDISWYDTLILEYKLAPGTKMTCAISYEDNSQKIYRLCQTLRGNGNWEQLKIAPHGKSVRAFFISLSDPPNVKGDGTLREAFFKKIYAVKQFNDKEISEKRPRLPSFVNWDLKGAETISNGIRTKIYLNGWWRFKSPEISQWLYRKVPNCPDKDYKFDIKDATGAKVREIGQKKLDHTFLSQGRFIFEREFSIPKELKDKDIYIGIDCVIESSEVFLNDKRMGFAWEMLPYLFKIPVEMAKQEKIKLTVFTQAIPGDVYMLSAPPIGIFVDDTYLITSVEQKGCKLEIEGKGIKKSQLEIFVSSEKDMKKIVKKAGPFVFDPNSENWKKTFNFPWENPAMWSPEAPTLYYYSVRVSTPDGILLDETLPQRFGFREFTIKGGDFFINGKRVALRSDSCFPATGSIKWPPLGVMSFDEHISDAIDVRKKLNLNCFEFFPDGPLSLDRVFDLADEKGVFTQLMIPNFKDFQQVLGGNEEIKSYAKKRLEACVRKYRQHPSLIFYFNQTGACIYDYFPSKLGAPYNPDTAWGKADLGEAEVIKEVDPVRVTASYSRGGVNEPIHTSMSYINFDADMQVHENWPLAWSKSRRVPVMVTEFSFVCHPNWFARPLPRSFPRQGSKPLFMEYESIYYGENAYTETPDKLITDWIAGKCAFTMRNAEEYNSSYFKLKTDFAKNELRAWRTYGISFALHAELTNGFNKQKLFKAIDKDPRRRGYTIDYQGSINNTFESVDNPLNETGRALQQAMMPLLTYIGGSDGRFTLKDHCFFSDEKIRKAIVVVNDTERDVQISGKWFLRDISGKNILSGDISDREFKQGEIATKKINIEFNAPDVKKRTNFTISYKLNSNVTGVLSDSFEITVFPKEIKALKIPEVIKVYLFDPSGETAALMKKADIDFTTVSGFLPDPANTLLVIGRNALKSEENFKKFSNLFTKSLSYGFDSSLERGLRVLVFEQGLECVMGMRTEQRRWRHAFIRAPGHPVFDGLEGSDFHYLKGDSNLEEAFPEPEKPQAINSHPKRFPAWGNDNVMATYSFEKPQIGAGRSLLDCGFEMGESPLYESVRGKGRIIFCQVDVSNRYGDDPVSTLIVNNLFMYLSMTKEPNPEMDEPIDLCRDDVDGIKIKTDKFFRIDKPDGNVSWGISLADLYFGEWITAPAITADADKEYLYMRLKDGMILHTLKKKAYSRGNPRAKIARILAALRINQGGSSDEGPCLELHNEPDELYPNQCFKGMVHPYKHVRW